MEKFPLENNKPIKYPSNDQSLYWPSFRSINGSKIWFEDDKILQPPSGEFNDLEMEKHIVPHKLHQFCDLEQFSFKRNNINEFQYNVQFVFFKNCYQLCILIICFIIPSFSLNKNFDIIHLYKITTIIICSFEIILLIISLINYKKKFKIKKGQLKHILNIVLCLIFILIQNDIYFGFFYYYLFINNMKIIKKFLHIIKCMQFKLYKNIQLIIITGFHFHLLTCLWQNNIQSINYLNALEISFQQIYMNYEDITNNSIELTLLKIVNFFLNFYLLIQFLNSKKNKEFETNLNSFHLFLYTKSLDLKQKIIIFNNSNLFIKQILTYKEKQKKNILLLNIKTSIIKNQLNSCQFMTDNVKNNICIYAELIKSKLQQINGLCIIFNGEIEISLMGKKISKNLQINQFITNLSLLQLLSQQTFDHVKLNTKQDVIYYYINEQDFLSCFQLDIEKEQWQLVKDQVTLYNNTQLLSQKCYFCEQYHLSFNCYTHNVKMRCTYLTTFQERSKYKRKKMRKTRSAIFYQITYYQGTSNNNAVDDSSESFEVFSDQSISLQDGFKQISSAAQFPSYKDMLQVDFISDKFTDPLVSSTLLKQLTMQPDIVRRKSSHQISLQPPIVFQDFDSFFDIDKGTDFKHYNVNFNISNVIALINMKL